MIEGSSRIGLVIPTLNAGERWAECLDAINAQSVTPYRLLNIDSASTDATPSLAQEAGFEVVRIERSQFNHGGTRHWAAQHLSDCDVIVFLTQDAILASPTSLAEISNLFLDPGVAVAYGRQLPHQYATPIEAHARQFNYGAFSLRKDSRAIQEFGAKVFFSSNSFAAYRRSTLLALGGFRGDLILGEDMEFAARAIKAGYANIYCATATVFHSHDYTFVQTLERYFDIGVFDMRNSWMLDEFGSHKNEGLRFVSSELRYLAKNAPLQIPRAISRTFAKLLGYRLGRLERLLPLAVKRRLSLQPGYWRATNP
jgi:GT2 family glycosyltransferase